MLSGLINTQEKTMLGIELIRLDGGTQPREGLNEKYIAELVEAIAEGATLPPVDVMYDGSSYWLYDGFHRLAATRHANRASIAATVHQGDQAAAQWESYAANQSHGLRRSTADKERAIRAALKHPTGVKMANNLIAKHLGVSDKTVTRYREIMESASEIPKVTERQGADGKVYSTERIGANRPVAQSPNPQPALRRYESGLPALNIPAPGAPPSTFGPQPKAPITDWELSDICETVATEYFGEITRDKVVAYAEAMASDAKQQRGAYWDRLIRALAFFDASVIRIQAAISDAARRMTAEHGALAPVSTMTPEAKQLSREIKAATWGDKPYAEVWEIQNALGRWEHGLTAAELRTLAKYRGGANWFDCRVALGEMHYRDRDLVQALNNIASQMEQRQGEGETASVEVDPWVAAWAVRPYDSIVKRMDRLVAEIESWAQAWTDDKDRTWRDVAERNPQHANSPFRQELDAECRRRGLALSGEEMAETIKLLFHRLRLDAPMEAPADGEKLLTEWTEADWVNYSAAKSAQTAAPDVVLPAHLASTWSPRFVAGGVYLVDVVRNRSTETVGVGQFDELFAQAERMDAALIVSVDDTPLPAWVTGEPEPKPAPLTGETLADVLRPLVSVFYADGSDSWPRHAALDMRRNASDKDGAFWRRCVGKLDAAGYRQGTQWTAGLLRQALGLLADEAPPVAPPIEVPLKTPPDARIGQAQRLIAIYQQAIRTENEYGELTGCFTETIGAKRELQKLIKRLQHMVDLLEGRTVAALEGCD